MIARVALVAAAAMGLGCGTSSRDAKRDEAAALAAAQDTAARQWKHEVGVDSVQTRSDTTIVWVSPRNWLATDAPQAGVKVLPTARIVGIQWIMGG